MLYPLKNVPLTPEMFANPGCEYRATPFWAWNNRLDPKELCWQIEQFKKMGFGGFHMHVRTGMATEYLSDEYLRYIHACADKAEQEDMLAWLYDEDRWPSGAAGGLVTKDHRYRQRSLVFSREKRDERLLVVYDVLLNHDGTLNRWSRIDEEDEAEGFKLYVYVQVAEDDPWYNNQAYVNTLDPESIQQFIEKTYVAFERAVGDQFGKRVPAVFTDEPQFSRKGTLSYAQDTRPVKLPWTDNLPETFMEAYGEDILESLPELLWDLPDGKVSVIRYHFHDHIAERFAQAFADQCGAWCEEHGLMLTGHMMEEPTLESQTAALGEAMRSYRSFQLPGIDMLCDWREYTTAKQTQSASRQFGREGVLSELYGVTNWNFDFRGHKLQGDWQAALGVTVRVPHLSWVSMNGEAKRDYPGTFNYQAPWYKEYAYVEDHFARVNTALTRGKARCRVGVVHPVESYWLHWGAKENTEEIRAQMDARFKNLTAWLLKGLIDFDFISESLLPQQCDADFDAGCGFPVGEMCYETVIVPPVETLRTSTIERLQHFVENGGRVIFLGDAPFLADAVPSELPGKLYDMCEKCAFDRVALLERLADMRDLIIRDESGVQTDYLLYQMREEGDSRWLFVCQADRPENPDTPKTHHLSVRMRGAWKLELFDTLTGEISDIPAQVQHGWTVYETPFHDHDSMLLRLPPASETEIAAAEKATAVWIEPTAVGRFLNKLEYTIDEPNVLLLDMAEYALDDEEYQPAEEILRLDNILRDRIGWVRRGNRWAQPWVESDRTTPHTLHLRYRFESNVRIEGAVLALENAENSSVTLNGALAKPEDGWYVDKCIGKQALPPIVPGENVLEIRLPYGKTVNVEACYLLGDFGVEVQGVHCRLTERPKTIAFGDITRQGFPFYGGNLTYRMPVKLEKGVYELEVSAYRAHLLRVSVDGEDQGVLAYAPYRKSFEIREDGDHVIELTAFGCRINTFGQVHHADKTTRWWGPDSWRSKGILWSYEYKLWEQGVLKSPELFRI
ncbi:MAG: hypothetical protein IJO98_02565 [Clostridia bacterium]|nr:hypothetical protein [Clostridia bacterium]